MTRFTKNAVLTYAWVSMQKLEDEYGLTHTNGAVQVSKSDSKDRAIAYGKIEALIDLIERIEDQSL